MSVRFVRCAVSLVVCLAVGALGAWAVPPDEVANLGFTSPTTLGWDTVAGVDDYNVYRGLVSQRVQGHPARCHGNEILVTSFESPGVPAAG